MKRLLSLILALTLLLCAGGVFVFASEPEQELFPPDDTLTSALLYLSSTQPDTWRTLSLSVAGALLADDDAYHQGVLQADERVLLQSPSAEDLAIGIIDIVKLDENPASYKRLNILSELYSHPGLFTEGVDVVALTLAAYQSAGGDIPVTAKNAESSVIDFIVSSQQISGGFSSIPGKEPSVYTTALVTLSLSAYKEQPYVAATLERAVTWLSLQQKKDGSFGSGLDTAIAAAALAACNVSETDVRFIKSESSIIDGLMLFSNPDGGFSNAPDGPSSAAVTEWAVIALKTSQNKISPFLPANQYEGYVSRPKPLANALSTTEYIIGGGVLFLCLLIAFFIIWERRRVRLQNERAIADTSTLEMNIQMQAHLPDFRDISEKESSPFRTMDLQQLKKPQEPVPETKVADSPKEDSAQPEAENN